LVCTAAHEGVIRETHSPTKKRRGTSRKIRQRTAVARGGLGKAWDSTSTRGPHRLKKKERNRIVERHAPDRREVRREISWAGGLIQIWSSVSIDLTENLERARRRKLKERQSKAVKSGAPSRRWPRPHLVTASDMDLPEGSGNCLMVHLKRLVRTLTSKNSPGSR